MRALMSGVATGDAACGASEGASSLPPRAINALESIADNVAYIRGELPGLSMPDAIRTAILAACARFDPVVKKVSRSGALYELGSNAGGLMSAFEALHAVVLQLREASALDSGLAIVDVLIEESGGNMLSAHQAYGEAMATRPVQDATAQSVSAQFGCLHCWPDSAECAWDERGGLEHEAELVDESHFHVMVLRCGSCHQHYVSIFTELIDWADGEDPQHWIVLPVTPEEMGKLGQAGNVRESMLNALGPDRRSLIRDCPKGAEAKTYWSVGARVPMHD